MSEEFIKIVVSEPQKVEESQLTSYVTYKVRTAICSLVLQL